jgi:hypothetical protein
MSRRSRIHRDEAFQGHGFVTAGARALVDHAFDDLGLNRIEIRCAPSNAASRAVCWLATGDPNECGRIGTTNFLIDF